MSALVARLRGRGVRRHHGTRGRHTPSRGPDAGGRGEAGFDMVIDSGREKTVEKIRAVSSAGVDRVIVSSPPESLTEALAAVRFGGMITFYGLHLGGRNIVPIDVNDLIFRKISPRSDIRRARHQLPPLASTPEGRPRGSLQDRHAPRLNGGGAGSHEGNRGRHAPGREGGGPASRLSRRSARAGNPE